MWDSNHITGYLGFDMWVYGKVQREERVISHPIGQECLKVLYEHWPDVEDYELDIKNYVGFYDAYREPYSSKGVSWYKFNHPKAGIMEKFGLKPIHFTDGWGDAANGWYGLKFDLETKEYTLKLPMAYNDFTRGMTPDSMHADDWFKYGRMFFSRTFKLGGERDPRIDYYYTCNYRSFARHCELIGLDMPVSEEIGKDFKLWSTVFNYETRKYEVSKAYEKIISKPE